MSSMNALAKTNEGKCIPICAAKRGLLSSMRILARANEANQGQAWSSECKRVPTCKGKGDLASSMYTLARVSESKQR